MSKHEALGKETAEVVTRMLESLGFSVWLSRDQADVDEAGMRFGVLHSMATLLIMTPGIFQEDRYWVTHVEVMTAIEAKKPLICLGKGFKFTPKVDVNGRKYSAECVVGVAEDFQPYARAIPICLEVLGWANQKDNREAALRCIVRKFLNGKKDAKKLRDRIGAERKFISHEGLSIPSLASKASATGVAAPPAPSMQPRVINSAAQQRPPSSEPPETTQAKLERAKANLAVKQAANFTSKLETAVARTQVAKAVEAHAAVQTAGSKPGDDSLSEWLGKNGSCLIVVCS